MNVRERQNSQRSLDRLVAMRLLYRRVKYVENWRLALVMVVALSAFWGLVADGDPFTRVATTVVVFLWFVDQVVLVRCAVRLKEEAAVIQEDFDCYVLDIPWPEHSGVKRPTEDRVKELATKGRNIAAVGERVANWYRGDIPADALAARLHCQRANCRWDSRLRGEWICLLSSTVLALAGVGFALAAFFGITVLEVVLAVAAGLRLLAWLLVEYQAQKVARKRMVKLHRYLSRAGTQAGQMTLCDVRVVQTAIFEHRRTCPTVPDWFYRLRRDTHEAMERP